jgi:hypothetical protein
MTFLYSEKDDEILTRLLLRRVRTTVAQVPHPGMQLHTGKRIGGNIVLRHVPDQACTLLLLVAKCSQAVNFVDRTEPGDIGTDSLRQLRRAMFSKCGTAHALAREVKDTC